MDWANLLSAERWGKEPEHRDHQSRTAFQRDFDRVIFSTAFRRLQGKTQVFPLPESDMTHTRLIHSLEASCVGRSLGAMVACKRDLPDEISPQDVGAIVAASALAHDIGNPPFGHSGENAIAEYFRGEGKRRVLCLSEVEQEELANFEGNAMGFRLLCRPSGNRRAGSMCLTYSTLAAYTKYPCTAEDQAVQGASSKKRGLFVQDRESFGRIADRLGVRRKEHGGGWFRHPLAFLTEAADDICYTIMDLEDGYKQRLVTYEEVRELLKSIEGPEGKSISERERSIGDEGERVGYFRARAINKLAEQAAVVFKEKFAGIKSGECDVPLLDQVPAAKVLADVKKLSQRKIYCDRSVVSVEAAGYEVLARLLDAFLDALGEDDRRPKARTIKSLLPVWVHDQASPQDRIMNVVEYVAGMTDTFAIDTFRVLRGIDLPNY